MHKISKHFITDLYLRFQPWNDEFSVFVMEQIKKGWGLLRKAAFIVNWTNSTLTFSEKKSELHYQGFDKHV